MNVCGPSPLTYGDNLALFRTHGKTEFRGPHTSLAGTLNFYLDYAQICGFLCKKVVNLNFSENKSSSRDFGCANLRLSAAKSVKTRLSAHILVFHDEYNLPRFFEESRETSILKNK
jgi:hypothetical protein